MDEWPIDVTVLAGGQCPEDPTCPHLLDLGDPEFLHFIGVPENRDRLLSHRDVHGRIGPGEVLYRWPRTLGLPEVPPA